MSDDESDVVDSSSYASSSKDGDSEFDPNNVDEYDDVDENNGEKFYSSRPMRPPRDAVEFVKAVTWFPETEKSGGCRKGFAYDEMHIFSREVVKQIHEKDGKHYDQLVSGIFMINREDADQALFTSLRTRNVGLVAPYFCKKLCVFSPRLVPANQHHRITCPNCGFSCLITEHHKEYSEPRLIVDLVDSYYLMCDRYSCGSPTCTHKTFTADSTVMASMPECIRHKFPAWLSHRAGISLSVFSKLTDSIYGGMSFRQFARDLLAAHQRNFVEAHTRFKQICCDRVVFCRSSGVDLPRLDAWNPIFEATAGYGGRVQQAAWFKAQFIVWGRSMLPLWRARMQQVDCTFCCLDHSFKIPSYMAKMEHMSLFEGLLTVMGSNGIGRPKIRSSDFVMSKSAAEVERILMNNKRVDEALGKPPPNVFYTDICCNGKSNSGGDRETIGKVYPNMAFAVANERMPNGDVFDRFRANKFEFRNAEASIAAAVNDLHTRMRAAVANGEDVYMSVDTENEVRLLKGRPPAIEKISVIQLAAQIGDAEVEVYVLQFWHVPAAPPLLLPNALQTLLEDPLIIKVGCKIRGDATKLKNQFDCEMRNHVELGAMMHERGLSKTLNISLKDMVAVVLKKNLVKDSCITVSTWAAKILTDPQKQYAADDAAAGAAIYAVLLTKAAVTGAARLHQRDRAPIPGEIVQICSHADRNKVVGCGVICKVGGLGKGHGAVWRAGHVDMLGGSRVTVRICDAKSPAYLPLHNVIDCGKRRTLLQWKNSNEELLVDIKYLQRPAVDAVAVAPFSEAVAPNRCLLDGFHALKRIRLALKCAEKKQKESPIVTWLMDSLRDAMYVVNDYDLQTVKSKFEEHEINFFSRYKYDWDSLRPYFRRVIPQPGLLQANIEAVMSAFNATAEGMRVSELGDGALPKAISKLMSHVRHGCLSDPPDLELYSKKKVDKYGLQIYRCHRGTNSAESGLHRHLIKKFASKNMSVEYSCIFLAFFCDRYNCDASDLKLGHYNPELFVDLRNYHGSIYGEVIYAGVPSGYEYELQDDLHFMVPMTAPEILNPDELKCYQPTVRYLAEKMKVRHPEISQFNTFERIRFASMVQKHIPICAARPNFASMRSEWNGSNLNENNTYVNGFKPRLIHAKAERHLEDYYDTHYLRSLQFKLTMNYVKDDLDLALKKQRELNPKGCAAEVQQRPNPGIQDVAARQAVIVDATSKQLHKRRESDADLRVYKKKQCSSCGMSKCGGVVRSAQYKCDSFTTYQHEHAGERLSNALMRAAYNEGDERKAFIAKNQ